MVDQNKIKEAIKLLLEGIGEDVTRDGLLETPDRIARMYTEIFAGLDEEAKTHLSKTFQVERDKIEKTEKTPISGLVVERDIVFYSMCEHHFMPFYGKAHVAYIPDGKVVGLSKLARTVEVYAKRPQIQEKMTAQIADAIMEYLNPKGVMVMLEAEHMCMTMRGVKKPGSKTVTVETRGICTEDDRIQNTFFRMVQ